MKQDETATQAEQDFPFMLERLAAAERWIVEVDQFADGEMPMWIMATTIGEVLHWVRNGGDEPRCMIEIGVLLEDSTEGDKQDEKTTDSTRISEEATVTATASTGAQIGEAERAEG